MMALSSILFSINRLMKALSFTVTIISEAIVLPFIHIWTHAYLRLLPTPISRLPAGFLTCHISSSGVWLHLEPGPAWCWRGLSDPQPSVPQVIIDCDITPRKPLYDHTCVMFQRVKRFFHSPYPSAHPYHPLIPLYRQLISQYKWGFDGLREFVPKLIDIIISQWWRWPGRAN